MSDDLTALRKRLAVEIMGWVVPGDLPCDGGLWDGNRTHLVAGSELHKWRQEHGIKDSSDFLWHPDESNDQAMMVRDRICQKSRTARMEFKHELARAVRRRCSAEIYDDEVALEVTAADYANAADAWLRADKRRIKMKFGQAIEAMNSGKCVARSGWNGKNMHIYLEDMWSFPIREGIYKGQSRKYDPVICMFTAQGTHQPGWLASQADILAEDWEIVGQNPDTGAS